MITSVELMTQLGNIMQLMSILKEQGTTYDEARYLIANKAKCTLDVATDTLETFEGISKIKLRR